MAKSTKKTKAAKLTEEQKKALKKSMKKACEEIKDEVVKATQGVFSRRAGEVVKGIC